jgi:hypothetical protein
MLNSLTSQRLVLRIRGIVVWIRIRGYVRLNNGTNPDPAIFVSGLQDASKNYFFSKFFANFFW